VRWDDAGWEPWRPEEAARRLSEVGVPWYVAAGWAIDLFLGRQRVDVFREPWEDGEWISCRDDRIRLPYDEPVEHTPAGVPYAA
jgi:hypothetical protein